MEGERERRRTILACSIGVEHPSFPGLVRPRGFEPRTRGLKGPCSATELRPRMSVQNLAGKAHTTPLLYHMRQSSARRIPISIHRSGRLVLLALAVRLAYVLHWLE